MGHGFRSDIHCALGEIDVCLNCVWTFCMINYMWNTRVEKHNLRCSESRTNMKIQNLIEMNKMSGLAVSTTKKKK